LEACFEVSKKRKDVGELVDAIMDSLTVRFDKTIEAIARDVGSSWMGVSRALDLILKIQAMPRVVASKSPLGRGSVYRRERAPYTRKEEM